MSDDSMQPGDWRQVALDNWRVDIIYRTDGDWYMAAQRDTPSRRLFDSTAGNFDELAAAVAAHMTAIDAMDELSPLGNTYTRNICP
jgi:hypothetical protein